MEKHADSPGHQAPPRLRRDISMLNLVDLPPFSKGPRGSEREKLQAIRAAGYEGVQGADPALCAEAELAATAMANIHHPGRMLPLCRELQAKGYELVTVHAGTGMESDAEALELLRDIVAASEETGFPVFVETHRATLTQDIWRTVQFVRQVPGLWLNGDFSHWYTGLEMTYGDWERKMAFLQPVFDRVAFLHGRIGNSSCMQVDIGDGAGRPHVDHFRDMWTRCFAAFLRRARPGGVICFAPELLWPAINYARVFPDGQGNLVEEGDRWEQAAVLTRIAVECFEAAGRDHKGS